MIGDLLDAPLAAVAIWARYSGRTVDAYRHDLRGCRVAADGNLEILAATRPHIDFVPKLDGNRGLAASTIDRRLPTVCGFYRFAPIDGRIVSNPLPIEDLSKSSRRCRESAMQVVNAGPAGPGTVPSY